MDRMGNTKKLVFKIMWEDIRMTGKNKGGYPDPTASKAIQAADHMPEHTYRDYCILRTGRSFQYPDGQYHPYKQ